MSWFIYKSSYTQKILKQKQNSLLHKLSDCLEVKERLSISIQVNWGKGHCDSFLKFKIEKVFQILDQMIFIFVKMGEFFVCKLQSDSVDGTICYYSKYVGQVSNRFSFCAIQFYTINHSFLLFVKFLDSARDGLQYFPIVGFFVKLGLVESYSV